MPNINLLLEAEKRGILPEEKRALLEEARRRGLIPGTPIKPPTSNIEPSASTPIPEQEGGWRELYRAPLRLLEFPEQVALQTAKGQAEEPITGIKEAIGMPWARGIGRAAKYVAGTQPRAERPGLLAEPFIREATDPLMYMGWGLGKAIGKKLIPKALRPIEPLALPIGKVTAAAEKVAPATKPLGKGVKAAKQAAVRPPSSVSTLVDDSPLALREGATPKEIRDVFSGAKHSQIMRGNYVAEDVKKLVPDLIDRQALALYRDVGGNTTKLSNALKSDKFKGYEAILGRAINLPENAKQANTLLDKYFRETGRAGVKNGFLKEMLDNYINRWWAREPVTRLVTGKTPRTGLPKTTPHALQRKWKTLLQGIQGGGKPVTLDAADLVNIHSREFASVLVNNKLLKGLERTGLAIKTTVKKGLPEGYVRIGNTNTAVPDYLATGLKAIIEPNFVSRIDMLRGIPKYQGFVKTVDLSLSFFHHFAMTMQSLYETKFGLELLNPKLWKFVKGVDFRALELDGLQHTLMTANVDANMDIMRKLSKGNEGLARIVNAPGLRYGFWLMRKNNEFLFEKLQRWLKVMSYGKSTSKWLGKHLGASNEEIAVAKRSIAHEINAVYGGLNWESLGRTPSFVALNRILFLAPDWTWSNVILAKQAFQGGPGGAMARAHYVSALTGAGIITEGLNKLITGHYTNGNAPGHQFEVEVRPGIYVSLFKGGVGDLMRAVGLTRELGPLAGLTKFVAGKAAPFVRGAVGLLGNVDPYSRKIYSFEKDWLENTKSFLKYAYTTSGPIPFGLGQNIREYYKGEEDPWSYILSGVGIGRPGQTSEEAAEKERKKARRGMRPQRPEKVK